MTGTRMKTAMTNDITRAITWPSNLSRTSAMVIVRGPATPRPCRTRPASMTGKVCAVSASVQPAENSARPKYTAGLRPTLSDTGPYRNWPRPNPRNSSETTNWTSLAWRTPSVAPTAGSAGRIMSIDSATSAVSVAMSATNSTGPSAVDCCPVHAAHSGTEGRPEGLHDT